jgi:uncharacterized membrane protein
MILKRLPFFALFDDDELALLASQVDIRTFTPRQRIYKIGDSAGKAYVLLSGAVRVTTIDEDQQDVVFDERAVGDFFGFASLLDETPHQTTAVTLDESVCIEVERQDILTLVQRKPHTAMDMMAVLGHRLHAAQALIRGRSARNPNTLIEAKATLGERLADVVATFGGSWAFIVMTGALLIVYCAMNLRLGGRAWDPYPFILLNLILSMLAAVQAPVIMMSQNRQNRNDRLRGELDFEVNRRAASDIQGVAGKLNVLVEKVGDLDQEVRSLHGDPMGFSADRPAISNRATECEASALRGQHAGPPVRNPRGATASRRPTRTPADRRRSRRRRTCRRPRSRSTDRASRSARRVRAAGR